MVQLIRRQLGGRTAFCHVTNPGTWPCVLATGNLRFCFMPFVNISLEDNRVYGLQPLELVWPKRA